MEKMLILKYSSKFNVFICGNLQIKKAKFVITNINADIEASTTFDFIRALYTMRSFWLILHELMYVVQRKLLSFGTKWGKCDDYRLKSVLYILIVTAYHKSYFTTLGITSIPTVSRIKRRKYIISMPRYSRIQEYSCG